MIEGKLISNPTLSEMKNSNLELVVAGTNKGVLMVESEAQQLSEDEMLEAVEMGQKTYNEVIEAIIKLAKKAAKKPIYLTIKSIILERCIKQYQDLP